MSVFCQGLFEGKVVLVTGGGTGIGNVIARTFGEHGAKVAIASRKQVVLDAAKEELKANGIECIAIACDIRKPEMVALVVNEIIAVWGSLDVLVNNAAGNFPARIEDLSANAFKTVIDIDLQGTFNVSKAAFDAWMKENGGAIINITAPYENFGVAWQAHAAAAKAGVVSFTRSAAVEWRPLGIRVNGVAPGGVLQTEGIDRLQESLTNKPGAGVYVEAGDIASAVLFLASDAARCITGENLYVDGGATVDMTKMAAYES
ncbi:MAG: SDR family oxidoreductase [Pseudomonadales bacterium]|nr:SDR family oxidoreductase [Pseudomonadales bacterium]